MRKHALIIGASGEIGQAITQSLAEQGYSLSLHYHTNRTVIDQLCGILPDESVLELLQADLSNQTGIDQLINHLTFMPTDLVFAQGQPCYGLFQALDSKTIDQLYYTHLKATWQISQACLPNMIQQRSGNIVVIASLWGERGASQEVLYSSVKGAQIAFVKALAQEVASSQIRINAISPGFIQTKMNQQLSEVEREAIMREIPANRLGTTNDVANLVTFLLSNKSNYINGECVRLSGGW
ncbi:elongation factor P 5-aminopentanone reductase [Amphibacillus sediminis]|uniref:elongation factor P 5-aminopentanone reductase n=1 Tax=Amphibacillus sediminis TaxID=360185 RepID=UPI00082D443C|nr:SDR family oxidoreductase [Amphibacillus sediminis]